MDIRNVRDLVLDNIRFSSEETDEREPYYVEECLVCRQDVEVKWQTRKVSVQRICK